MLSTVSRSAAVVMLTMLLCLLLAAPRSSAATASDVKTSQEAWYHAAPAESGSEDPTCGLPTGCAEAPEVPVNPFADNTLQVGIAAGQDNAHSFVALDLTALPLGATVTGGTLTVPVLADGSVQPEAAKIAACPTSEPITEAQGGAPGTGPAFDCKTSSEGTFNAGDQPTITVDLTPLAATLTTAGIALVPSAAAQEAADTWRLAIPGKEHESEVKISATITYDEPPELAPLPPAPEPEPPAEDPGFATDDSFQPFTPGVGDQPEIASAPMDTGVPEPVAAAPTQPPVAAPPPAAPVAALTPAGYAYPAVWLLPLALVSVAGLLGRTLTQEPAAAALDARWVRRLLGATAE